jgi:hypothetical protein
MESLVLEKGPVFWRVCKSLLGGTSSFTGTEGRGVG